MNFNVMIDKAIYYYENNEDDLLETLNSIGLTSYGGWHPMSELQDEFEDLSPLDIMELAVNSWDKYSFDPDDEFFRQVDTDDLLESDNNIDFRDYIDADMITEIYNNRDQANLPKYINRLFETFLEDYEEAEEDEE